MKKTIKELAQFISMIMVIAGLVVCMCETTDFGKQIQTMMIGIAIIATGAVVSILVNRGEEDVYRR